MKAPLSCLQWCFYIVLQLSVCLLFVASFGFPLLETLDHGRLLLMHESCVKKKKHAHIHTLKILTMMS